MAKKNKILLWTDIEKEGVDVLLRIKATPEIEDFFKNQAIQEFGKEEKNYTQVSSKWLDKGGIGLKFYRNNKKVSDGIEKFINGKILAGEPKKMYYIQTTNNFGAGLFEADSQLLNIAPLRCAGISGENGIALNTTDLIPYEEMRLYIEQINYFTKAFFINFISKAEISAKLQLTT